MYGGVVSLTVISMMLKFSFPEVSFIDIFIEYVPTVRWVAFDISPSRFMLNLESFNQ